MARGSKKVRWIIGVVVVVVVLAVAIPFLVIHLILGKSPAKLTLPIPSTTTAGTGAVTAATSGSSSPSSGTTTVAGTWNVGSGSIVGYRVQEVLVGQSTTAVGRTSKVWGSISISGTSVATGSFTADMASVTSDQSQRNAQFDGRIMDVGTYPTATFKLTSPIPLGTVPADGTVKQFSATGDLTMHGVTNSIDISVSAERNGSSIDVLSEIPILFSKWNIANPSSAGIVTTASSGTLEVLLDLTKGSGNPVSVSSANGSGGFGGGPVTVPATTTPQLTVPKA